MRSRVSGRTRLLQDAFGSIDPKVTKLPQVSQSLTLLQDFIDEASEAITTRQRSDLERKGLLKDLLANVVYLSLPS